MFSFDTTDKRRLKVYFRYEREEVPANPNKENSKPHTRPVGTTCLISLENGTIVSGGYARCYYKDQFTYKSGRKHALRKALLRMGLDRDSRRNAWNGLLSKYNQV